MCIILFVEVDVSIGGSDRSKVNGKLEEGLVENILSYAVSVITALISGICAFIAAKKTGRYGS